jgi:glycosyltransferase involved in cell wall biosynthesis
MESASWGGSEELWSQTAVRLKKQGLEVAASLLGWVPPHERVLQLSERGVRVFFRPMRYSLVHRAARKIRSEDRPFIVVELDELLKRYRPSLVVFSEGGPFSLVDLLELCVANRVPFVTISQANSETWGFDDNHAARYRDVLVHARRCYFVSKANMRLAEKQIGADLPKGEVVWNPFDVGYDITLPWPPLKHNGELRLACVARLDPTAKGQDILLEALSSPSWSYRNWHLNLYGEGPKRDILERLVERFGLSGRVTFGGHRPVAEIWMLNHVLVMPSRHEGLPLAMVEAMLCARPVVATDVAGHAEVIEDGVTGFLGAAATAASVASTLERLWANRSKLQEMGAAGAKRIRELVPRDPAAVFAEKLEGLIETMTAPPPCPIVRLGL